MILKHKFQCHGSNYETSEEKFCIEEKWPIGYQVFYYYKQKKTLSFFNFPNIYYTFSTIRIKDCSFWKEGGELSFFHKEYNL